MTDYSKIKIPVLSRNQIEDIASRFRKRYWGDRSSPIDILHILEFDLKIRIDPLPDLEGLAGIDCFITSDWQSLVIDNNQFSDEYGRYDKRINFSVAHEIGHLILHKEFYESLKILSHEDLNRFIKECPEEKWGVIERQAKAFAGRVLVPKDELEGEIKKLIAQGKTEELSRHLQNRFNVSSNVIFKRILYEKIKIDIDY